MDIKTETKPVEEGQKFLSSTLKMYGHSLLIGVDNAGQLAKSFSFRRFTFKEELEIAKLRKRKDGPGLHDAKIATEVLAYMLTEWAGEDVSQKAHKHKLMALRSAFMEDVLYAWICLRVETMGEDLAIKTQCPACRHTHTWVTDLTELEVSATSEAVEPVKMALKSPIPWGDQEITHVVMMPPRWSSIYNVVQAGQVEGLDPIKRAVVQGAIYSAVTGDGTERPCDPRIREQMTKLDVERIAKAFDSAKFPRNDASFEIVCPECGQAEETSLDWTWGFFFGSASLPPE